MTRATWMLAMAPRLLVLLHDLLVVALTWVGLRWLASVAGAPDAPGLITELIVVIAAQGLMLWAVGLYRGVWRFASLPDLANLARAALLGLALIILVFWLLGMLPDIPRRVLLPYVIVLVFLLGAPRLLYRLWKDQRMAARHSDATRVVVLGAGRAAEMLLRDFRSDGRYLPVGLLDDSPDLIGRKVQGVPVLRRIDDVAEVARETAAQMLVIAMPGATPLQMRRVVNLCETTGLPFRKVPRLSDMLDSAPGQLRLNEVAIEDLLGRDPVKFDWEGVRASVGGKSVLITGAGGSIGSELARQCARAGAARLILLERAELPLLLVSEGLANDFPQVPIELMLADCGDAVACRRALRQRPDFVYHAAANKQVPLLEGQIREGLRNNVAATDVLASTCRDAGVGNFVLISTDKAVDPINVLGASKRFAELIVQACFAGSATRLSIVRFGNVLDSAGSVVPLFRRQIAEGGPVTVTHPEITRYFMTIPEACQLILQTAALPESAAAIYTLDMGRPVAIRELAEQMILLTGKRAGDDIRIEYIGLRPGEKLHERLFAAGERHDRTINPLILRAQPRQASEPQVTALLTRLLAALAEDASDDALSALLCEAVPEYTPATITPSDGDASA
ncbi:MAG TPA: nucleoside-diphosphate sugar epimerase/dehydratase [Arenimonas sp.]|uniref:nucleoside-diphosphate sugar epimerase/dehydratase n=1 Tax=Arenimonas sp. TaxID=1872635 RepID=UPI002CFCE840|nr:nucleoside-diphosphate sugar epimerase/dehydratase [Arenimonas sp.]HMB57450.1 nucleoside-diphosphate sugar epimerase/dehydratase [Arenimonas sp.]